MLKYSEYSYYIKQRDFHHKRALYHYNQIHMACWYCPRIEDQEKARICLVTATSIVGSTIPTLQLVTLIASFSVQYGLECMREWNFIQKHLYECQYNFEMYEFYMDVLAKA